MTAPAPRTRAGASCGALALAACMAACDSGGPPPPMDLAPPSGDVAAALKARVNEPDAAELTVRPAPDAPPACRDSYRVERVAVARTLVRDELGSRIKLVADFQVRRLAATDGAAASLGDCFGSDANAAPANWRQGAVALVKGGGDVTWRPGGYWLLRVGDEFIPLPPVRAGR